MWLTGLVALRHVGSSRTRARTCVPCIGRRILNHCATREAPVLEILTLITSLFCLTAILRKSHTQLSLTGGTATSILYFKWVNRRANICFPIYKTLPQTLCHLIPQSSLCDRYTLMVVVALVHVPMLKTGKEGTRVWVTCPALKWQNLETQLNWHCIPCFLSVTLWNSNNSRVFNLENGWRCHKVEGHLKELII